MSRGRDIEPFLSSQMRAFFFCSFLLFCFNPSFTAADIPEYGDCAPASCNGIAVHYPFSLSASTPGTSCSVPGLKLTCQGDKADALLSLITPTGLKLIVKSINYTTQTIKLAIDRSLPVVNNQCPLPSKNITVSDITNSNGESILSFATNYTMGIFFFRCSTKPIDSGVPNYIGGDTSSYNFTSNLVSGCSDPGATSYSYAFSDDSFTLASWTSCRTTLSFPVLISSSSRDARTMWTSLTEGFDVVWTVNSMGDCLGCTASGGRCGYNTTGDHFLCFCRQDAHSVNCNQPDAPSPSSSPESLSGNRSKSKIIIGVVSASSSFLLAIIGFFVWRCLGKKRTPSSKGFLTRSFSSSKTSSTIDMESRSFHQRCAGRVTIFTYKELEEATHNFSPSNELGDGGFGAVYLGNLHDGRKVAVKKLYENNYKRVEQFMNEIAILSGISHPNLVCLYGCTSRHSRELLLVYEYVNNGTVGDHIHGMRSSGGHLTWKVRLNIAVETAGALAHLHGLEPPIIHRDVKTNNILLDRDFHVKVADFGLSRLFPLDVTHVSTAPQGTPGYVDPDYHKCYQLTEKSDVYSFGVVLAELISSLPAVDIRRHRHEINLANLAVNKINNHELHEFVDSSLEFETDEWVNRTVRAVAELAFRCLVQEREIRPTMDEVAETLRQIQSGECESDKVALSPEKETGALLKPTSPKSVTDQWPSHYTTPNNSG
ncbi:LEAF RUST 10 DISEASE-RESISTANCE LOCUS RECEPTOR-LIKE PROTEIN KINASE-like 1.2 isoform X1 [Nymphaea colorata]|nr:LEAF RUST 10 DISEASE-RESISTANCE LOCUS RECEPTOR-LIKE PROTEIN KINASE-like 1.2 isoform X1 [Nymphaea colorata]